MNPRDASASKKASPISSAPLAAWPQPPAARTKPSPNFGFMSSMFGFICGLDQRLVLKGQLWSSFGLISRQICRCFSPYRGYQQKAQSCPGCLTWHRNLQSHRWLRDLVWELAPRWPKDKSALLKSFFEDCQLPAFLRDLGPDQSCNGSLRPPAGIHIVLDEKYSCRYFPLCATLWRDHGLQTWGSVAHWGRGLAAGCKCNERAPTATWCKDQKTIKTTKV